MAKAKKAGKGRGRSPEYLRALRQKYGIGEFAKGVGGRVTKSRRKRSSGRSSASNTGFGWV